MPRRVVDLILSKFISSIEVAVFATSRICFTLDLVVFTDESLLWLRYGRGDDNFPNPRTSLTVGTKTYPKKKHLAVISQDLEHAALTYLHSD